MPHLMPLYWFIFGLLIMIIIFMLLLKIYYKIN